MRISDWSSDVCSSDLSAQGHHPSPSPACGRRWREAPDEGASAASCSCSCIQQRQTSKAALRFARAPSSALRAPSPVKREKGCISNPPLRFNPPARSEERQVGKKCVSQCRSRLSPAHSKKKQKKT